MAHPTDHTLCANMRLNAAHLTMFPYPEFIVFPQNVMTHMGTLFRPVFTFFALRLAALHHFLIAMRACGTKKALPRS